MSKRESKMVLLMSGGNHYIGKIWSDEFPPKQIRDASPVMGGLVNTAENRVALQVITPPYGCAEGTLKVLNLGSVDSWVFIDDLSDYDKQTVKDFLERKAKSDAARRAADSGIVLPNGLSPEELSKITRGARG